MKRLTLLIDADDTILDFGKGENNAINQIINNYELNCFSNFASDFSEINLSLWKMFELGEIDKDDISWKRFEILFGKYAIGHMNSKKVGEEYKHYLAQQGVMIEGAKEFLDYIENNHDIYCVTNGIASTQKSRFKIAGLDKYFIKVFVSEKLNARKPQKEFFQKVFDSIPDIDLHDTYIIGDSLSSDIAGGINSGIKTIWTNFKKEINSTIYKPDYEINNFEQLKALIDKLSKYKV